MAKDEAESGKKKAKLIGPGRILSIAGLMMAIVFLPTAILIGIGMLPSLIALLIDKATKRGRALTVAAMNLAGCTPFVLQLWIKANTVEHAMAIITDPRTVVVMYSAACIGYAVDWAVSGLVASFMVQTSTARLQQIVRRRSELVERWGKEVTGEVATDRQGFLVEDDAGLGKR